MKLLSRILNGSNVRPPFVPSPEPTVTIEATTTNPPVTLDAPHGVFGPGTILSITKDPTAEQMDEIRERFRLASATNQPPVVLPDAPVVTPVTCTALTTKHARCLLTPQPGSDRCAMPAHSHERQP